MNTRIDFSPEDERAMASAASWGFFIAIGSIAGVVLSLVTTMTVLGVGGLAVAAVGAFVNLTLSILLFNACAAFRKVALTDEDDHRILLRGFSNLRYYFLVQGLLIILAMVGGLVVAVAMPALM